MNYQERDKAILELLTSWKSTKEISILIGCHQTTAWESVTRLLHQGLIIKAWAGKRVAYHRRDPHVE